MAAGHDNPPDGNAGGDPNEMMSPEFLAALHGARQLHRQVAEKTAAPQMQARRVTTHDIWKHARRLPGEPVSLAVERAIRTDAAAAARYRKILTGFALAHTQLARAASDGAITSRRVGLYTFEMVKGDGPPLLLIRLGDGAGAPAAVELRRGEESLRISLGEPINGAVFLSLDPTNEEGRQLAALVADPTTEIFVL
jgi:hypothetical protein